MCNFFSCIVKKDKSVIWEPGIDNQHELLEMHNIPDNTDDPAKMKFARVEIIPPGGVPFAPLGEWTFSVDERIRPVWFSPAHEKACWGALECCVVDIDNSFSGYLYLRGYDHALPEGFESNKDE